MASHDKEEIERLKARVEELETACDHARKILNTGSWGALTRIVKTNILLLKVLQRGEKPYES